MNEVVEAFLSRERVFVVGDYNELEKPLSDHKPIWAEIAFPRQLKKVQGSE